MNPSGKKISLTDIARVDTEFRSHDIHTDDRIETIHLYGEMGANSVVYPILELYGIFGSDTFSETGYRKIASSPYSITFVSETDGKKYTIKW